MSAKAKPLRIAVDTSVAGHWIGTKAKAGQEEAWEWARMLFRSTGVKLYLPAPVVCEMLVPVPPNLADAALRTVIARAGPMPLTHRAAMLAASLWGDGPKLRAGFDAGRQCIKVDHLIVAVAHVMKVDALCSTNADMEDMLRKLGSSMKFGGPRDFVDVTLRQIDVPGTRK